MKRRRVWALGFLATLACVALATAQERPNRPAAAKLPDGVRAFKDLAYVPGGHERQRLDLYLPEKPHVRLPVIVWIHGGAWIGGSKEHCPALWLVPKGYAVASVNYRLSQHALFPAQIEDCKAAVRWLRANAGRYGLDPQHVGVWGASAGGHLVALLGTTGEKKGTVPFGGAAKTATITPDVAKADGARVQGGLSPFSVGPNLNQPSRVQCVVDWFGPSDFTLLGRKAQRPDNAVARLIGGSVDEHPEKARQASPVTYVGKDAAPFLIMHGDKDNVVPLRQSEILAEALKTAGAEVKLVVIEGNGHGGPGFNTPENRKLIEDFFLRHLGKALPVKITISKETTYLTGPLRPDGFVDYVAALNERCRAGVTPENNAAVPMVKAMGLDSHDPKYREEYFRMLGIPALPEKGDYYVSLGEYVKRLKASGDPAPVPANRENEDAYGEGETMKRPWTAKEFPVMAGWLAANEKALAGAVEASKRPRRYDPLIAGEGGVIATLLPMIRQYRDVARALTARAMLRVGEGKSEEAWDDLAACYRLARLIGQGPFLVDALAAFAVEGIARDGSHGLLQEANLTTAQIARVRADFEELPPTPRIGDKIDISERFSSLDCVRLVAHWGLRPLVEVLQSLIDDKPAREPKPARVWAPDALLGGAVDWDRVLRSANSWYNRLADAARRPTRAERQLALGAIEQDLEKLSVAFRADLKPAFAPQLWFGPREGISERVDRAFVAMLLPGVAMAVAVEDRVAMQSELTRLAFTLAAYRADHGSYPAKLADLVPKYIAAVPKDIFNDAELHYTPQQGGAGYLLYSVGVNGKDDGGKDYREGQVGDDLVVRMEPGK